MSGKTSVLPRREITLFGRGVNASRKALAEKMVPLYPTGEYFCSALASRCRVWRLLASFGVFLAHFGVNAQHVGHIQLHNWHGYAEFSMLSSFSVLSMHAVLAGCRKRKQLATN